MKTPRLHFLGAFFFVVGILSGAAYFQFMRGYEPCALCILQRVIFIIIAIILLIGACHNPGYKGWRVYNILLCCMALVGVYFAGHQIWLQHLPPDRVPSCGPGLNFLLQNFPWWIALREFFSGVGQCAVVSWRWLGLSFAEWALLCFSLLFLFGAWQIRRK